MQLLNIFSQAAMTGKSYYLMRLESPFLTANSAQELLGSSIPLPVLAATRLSEGDTDDKLKVEEDDYEDDDEEDENDDDHDMAAETYFIRLSPSQLKMLIAALKASHPSFRPLTIHGFDAGKAVHRALEQRSNCLAARRLTSTPASRFPMYYFFYGTLAQPDKLTRVLELSAAPQYKAATIGGFKAGTIGEYKALVEIEDESEDEQIEGEAYLVASEEHAEKLAEFETDLYVSVDVEIALEGGRSVVGRTFART
jgi:gamma-glutamylcyclotransferase (GGCT)/AIG2-like uncharacterized protein YtfP